MRARLISGALAFIVLSALAGCETTPSANAPGATVSNIPAPPNDARLAGGRALFIGRCARCHALPKIAAYPAEKWPSLVAEMSKRSGLKPVQSDSMVEYILSAHPQSQR